MREIKTYRAVLDGRYEAIVAAPSAAAAARAMDVTPGFLRDRGGVTGNQEQIAMATAEPGCVFLRVSSLMTAPYIKVAPGEGIRPALSLLRERQERAWAERRGAKDEPMA